MEDTVVCIRCVSVVPISESEYLDSYPILCSKCYRYILNKPIIYTQR